MHAFLKACGLKHEARVSHIDYVVASEGGAFDERS